MAANTCSMFRSDYLFQTMISGSQKLEEYNALVGGIHQLTTKYLCLCRTEVG